MKVFISWSGHRSHEVAEALAEWLKKVIQSAEPWVSSEVERGVKWLTEIGKSLDAHSIGILCVTPGNISAPWLNFEAGALSKQIGDDVRVIPYLLDFRSASELQPPLGQFNASLADEAGTRDLVKTLNAHSEAKLTEANLDETFQLWWPSLHDKLEAIRTNGSGQPPRRRTIDDKIDELLDLTRQLMLRLPWPTAENALDRLLPFIQTRAFSTTDSDRRALVRLLGARAGEPTSANAWRAVLASLDTPAFNEALKAALLERLSDQPGPVGGEPRKDKGQSDK